MHKVSNIPVVLINPLLTCKLCGGYLIDATTIVECLHSFCRSCIVGYLELHTTCPICDTLLHKTRPHYAIRPDRALQAIVYKLIPDLFEKEMAYRRQFYKEHPCSELRSLSPEKRGDITINTYFIQEEEHISIELAYWQPDNKEPVLGSNSVGHAVLDYRSTFLLCPPDLTVGHLEKLIRTKFGLKPVEHEVALFFSSDDLFSFDYTLSDLTCLYSWRSHQPMRVYFTIMERCQSGSSTDSPIHSAKFGANISKTQPAQSFSITTCTSSSSFENTNSTATEDLSHPPKFPPPPRSISTSNFLHSSRTDFPSREAGKLRDSYFADHWNRPEHCSYVDSPFDKQVPSKSSVESMTLSPTSLSTIGNATSVCSPRA
ncbi:Polycomb group RING finger protein 2 [Fasciola hepatica]|uniref:Polycomb group RING finger protein 2 n=1 Tax=Fasciola hepatica TaxID=6192 RepID=A0A4E0QY84_FASHE|nr:Polycomb group RING finger protein 2 [Fasciola hepatica]